MSYNSEFELAFIERSLLLVKNYQGPFDATLLLNCLLGLLIVPKEKCLQSIPLIPISELKNWGINPEMIIHSGSSAGDNNNPKNLRGLVWRLRNAVAHSSFKPITENNQVTGFNFRDKSGFEAIVPLDELRRFVEKLALQVKSL